MSFTSCMCPAPSTLTLWRALHITRQLQCASRRRGLHMQPPSAARQVSTAASAQQNEGSATDEQSESRGKRLGKRKVALHLGYEGSGYRGLQLQRTAPKETIEDQLEAAIFAIGGILPSNFGKLSKLGWSRSSRTDKSVHSLSTVVAMKMEVDAAAFEADPEGLLLAERINAHLPEDVQVFSVQRVSKSFNARSECVRRRYHYYLPLSILKMDGSGSPADQQRLQLLRSAWALHSGFLPYHNYTKRALYRKQERGRRVKGKGHGGRGQRGEGGSTAESEEEEEEEEEGEQEEEEEQEQEQQLFSSSSSSTIVDGSSSSSAAASHVQGPPRGRMQLRWYSSIEEAEAACDPVVRRHYRLMEAAECSDVTTVIPGGTPCVQLSITGASFMLYQIRHMVGMAVAVARGKLPLELAEASLAAPGRLSLPLAPASTLILADCEFLPFRQSYGGTPANTTQWTGERLTLRDGGQAARDGFAQRLLLPAVNGLLTGPQWERWEEHLSRMWYDEAEAAELLSKCAAWKEEVRARREQRSRLEAMQNDAAALENVQNG